MEEFFKSVKMNEARFLNLLEKLIGESKYLQNSPPQGLIPQENLASNHVLDVLRPFSTENGGPLTVERVEFVKGRGNVIITYPGTTDKICSFVGSHLDVVPAQEKGWDRDPFKLLIEGDDLYGRGTTDCLGHVAMLTDLMASLAEAKPPLKSTIVVIFIANEENGTFKGIGVDQLAAEGYMDKLLSGPLFWIDSADSNPCIGTCGNLQWKMEVSGKPFHSGLPHKGINAIEYGMDALSYLQRRFFEKFPKHPREAEFRYATQSTLKVTRMEALSGAINQIPGDCILEGDVRITPFYDVATVRDVIDAAIAEVNANPSIVEDPINRGPHSKYSLPAEGISGQIKLTWTFPGENGVACNLSSAGHVALRQATQDVIGVVEPFGIGGSLPLIRELQDRGFDVQIAGYGLSSKYHGDNESAKLSSMKSATQIMAKIIYLLESR